MYISMYILIYWLIRLLSRNLFKKELEPLWPPPEKVSAYNLT